MAMGLTGPPTAALINLFYISPNCFALSSVRLGGTCEHSPLNSFAQYLYFYLYFFFARVVLGQLECIHCGKHPPL